MRILLVMTVTFSLVLLTVVPARAGNLEAFEFAGSRHTERPIRWPTRKITIALSSSLTSPGPNIKLGSDVTGAVERAFLRWSRIANINFVETNSTDQSVSSAGGDGVSLITVADTSENNALFAQAETTGRTRVFYDQETGFISEADICINPHPALSDGTPVQFSTDGTPGTYDLETTFTHEIGHLLGLDHSLIWSSTMQAHQALNGVYGLPAFNGRTISQEDLARVRSLYGRQDREGLITGKLSASLAGAHLWIEELPSGRIAASTVADWDGNYRLGGLAPGHFRVLAEQTAEPEPGRPAEVSDLDSPYFVEIAGDVVVNTNASIPIGTGGPVPQASQYLNPRFVGMNGDISTVALPLEAGKTFRILAGGQGIDQVPASGISIGSPFFKIDPSSLTRERFSSGFPVVSFQVTVAPNVPFGDYTLRFQSATGEIAYLAGSITIDPGPDSTTANPLDDSKFFVSQQYRDFLGRDGDAAGLDYWTNRLQQCGLEPGCTRTRRLGVSAAFFGDSEFQDTGSFVYGLYRTLGRRPTFAEFSSDRSLLISAADLSASRNVLASQFAGRQEFVARYPVTMSPEQFVDAVLAETQQSSKADGAMDRGRLLKLYASSESGRAAVVEAAIGNPGFLRAEYNRMFILMQYFAYLRRDPDEAGYNYWLNTLHSRATRDSEAFRLVTCAFLTSAEYQLRFGMVVTHTSSECAR